MSRTRRLAGAAVALASFGCASLAVAPPPLRVVRDRPLDGVVFAVLDSYAALGALGIAATPVANGAGAVVRGRVMARGFEVHPFVLEVRVTAGASEVRVAVTAEPAGLRPAPPGNVPRFLSEEVAGRSKCGCAGQDAIELEATPGDNLVLVAQGRAVVRTYLAALDARLR